MKDKTAICYLTNIPTPYRLGFLKELSNLVDLKVIFEKRYAKDRDKLWKVDSIEGLNCVFLDGPFVSDDTSISLNVIKEFKKNKYDLVILSMYSSPTSILLERYLIRHKIPFIISSDGGFPDFSRGIKKRIKKKLLSNASYWLSTGRITTDYLVSLGALEEKIFKYPFTSISNKDIISKEKRIELYELGRNKNFISNNEYIIVSVGQPIYRKGFDLLINAIRNLNNVKVYIIGGKPKLNVLGINEYPSNVVFVEFCKKTEVFNYLCMADLFCLPTREDIRGLVINEAMSVGLPILSTNKCIAATELVENGVNGFIVESNSIEQLKIGIEKCMNNFGMFNSRSIELIKEYTFENMALRHYEIFKKILKK